VTDQSVLRTQLRGVGGAVRAELLKMDKRPASWVLLAIAIALLGVLAYFLNWLLITHPVGNANPGVSAAQLKRSLYPPMMVATTVSSGELASALSLILGVLVVGSEYGWGTFKTLFTQRPGRLMTVIAKLLALEIALGAGVLLFFFVGAISSVAIAAIDQQPLNEWPAGDTMIEGVLATWLIWSWWALFGAGLAFAFRQSALPIGLGLAYRFVIETIILSLGGAMGGDFIRNVSKCLPGPNASALGNSFQVALPGSPPPQALVGAGQATLVLMGYCLAAVLLGAILVTRRDVT
jgi:ABC-2 type transport system permease protein